MAADQQILIKALQLVKAGMTPLPTIGKRCLLEGWPQLRDVTVEQVHHWNENGLLKNIGVLTGEASQNLVILDFDYLGKPDVQNGYTAFIEAFPECEDTHTVRTGKKGHHVYLLSDLLPNNLAVMTDDYGGIEIRAQNLGCIIPPSIHPDTGKRYEVIRDGRALRISDMSAIVQWVHGLTSDRKPLTQKLDYGPTSNELLEVLRLHFEAQRHKIHGDWLNCACPNPSHTDDNWSFGFNINSGTGNCFVCGSMSPRSLGEQIGIRIEQPVNVPISTDKVLPLAITKQPSSSYETHKPTMVTFKDLINASPQDYPGLKAKWEATHDYDRYLQSAKLSHSFMEGELDLAFESARIWLGVRASMRRKPATTLTLTMGEMKGCIRRGIGTLDDCVEYCRAFIRFTNDVTALQEEVLFNAAQSGPRLIQRIRIAERELAQLILGGKNNSP